MSIATYAVPIRSSGSPGSSTAETVGEWHASAIYTAQQTDTVVQAAPGVGYRLRISHIYIQVNAAVDVLLEQGTATTKFNFYGDAKGAGVAQSVNILLDENTNLTITTSGVVNVNLAVDGTVERI